MRYIITGVRERAKDSLMVDSVIGHKLEKLISEHFGSLWHSNYLWTAVCLSFCAQKGRKREEGYYGFGILSNESTFSYGSSAILEILASCTLAT